MTAMRDTGIRPAHQRLRGRPGISTRFVGYETRDIRHPLNIVPLCRLHHDLIERRVLVSTLRSLLRESEVIHIRRVAGPVWLDAHYPEPQIGSAP